MPDEWFLMQKKDENGSGNSLGFSQRKRLGTNLG